MGLVKIAQREQLLVSLMERVLNTLTGRLNMKRTYSTIETRLEVADYITKTVEIESRNITVEREKNREENVMAKPVAFNYQEYEKLKVRNTIKQILDYWKQQGFITGYVENNRKTEIVSVTIRY